MADFSGRVDLDVSVGTVLFGTESLQEELAAGHFLRRHDVGEKALVVVAVTHQEFPAYGHLAEK